VDLQACTVEQLKDKLRSKGLKVAGKKQDLIERLKVSEEASAPPAVAASSLPADQEESKEPEKDECKTEDTEAQLNACEADTQEGPNNAKVMDQPETARLVTAIADTVEAEVQEQHDQQFGREGNEEEHVGEDTGLLPDGPDGPTNEDIDAVQNEVAPQPKCPASPQKVLDKVVKLWQQYVDTERSELKSVDRLTVASEYRTWVKAVDLGDGVSAPAFTDVWLKSSPPSVGKTHGATEAATPLPEPKAEQDTQKPPAEDSKLASEAIKEGRGQPLSSSRREPLSAGRQHLEQQKPGGVTRIVPSRVVCGEVYSEATALAMVLDALKHLRLKGGEGKELSEADIGEALTKTHPKFRIHKTPFQRLESLLRQAAGEGWLQLRQQEHGIAFILQDLPKAFVRPDSQQQVKRTTTHGSDGIPPGHPRGRAQLRPAKGQDWPAPDSPNRVGKAKRARSDAVGAEKTLATTKARISKLAAGKLPQKSAKTTTQATTKAPLKSKPGKGQVSALKVKKASKQAKKKSESYSYESYSYYDYSDSRSSESSPTPEPKRDRARRHLKKSGQQAKHAKKKARSRSRQRRR